MNWLDVAILVSLSVGGLVGMRLGLIRVSAAFMGVFIGILVVSQLRDDAAAWLSGFLAYGTLVTVLSYAVTILATVALTAVVTAIVRQMVYGLFMGWADRLAGTALGLAAGGAVAAVMVLGMAALAHADVSGMDGAAGRLWEITGVGNGEMSSLDRTLSESALVSVAVEAADIVPSNLRGIASWDLRTALEDLKQRAGLPLEGPA